MITQNITLCIGASGQGEKVIVKCHDTGVNLFVRLEVSRHRQWRDVREPYNIPEGSTAVIKVAKPDKTFVLKDGEIIDNGIYFRMPKQTFTVPGVSSAEVSLYGETGRRITSASFLIEVDEECICDCEEESETYVDVFAEQLRAATEAADKIAQDAAAGKFDGKDGKDGEQGPQGERGEQGEKGERGEPGAAGYSPVRGTDYWTEADKAEIIEDMADEGYVKNTDYATWNKGGVIKVSPSDYGIGVNASGLSYIRGASTSEIDNKTSAYHPITPKTLAYAVKSIGDGYYATEEQVGDISAALDELHAYAQALIGGDA